MGIKLFLITSFLLFNATIGFKTTPELISENHIVEIEEHSSCNGYDRLFCAKIIYHSLQDVYGGEVGDDILLSIVYYGELSPVHHTALRDDAIEAFARHYHDSQAGLSHCKTDYCKIKFLSNSQHITDSVVTETNNTARVNFNRLTGGGKYLDYLSVAHTIIYNPLPEWTTGLGYDVPSIWANTNADANTIMAIEHNTEIFSYMVYNYNGCSYVFFIASMDYRIPPDQMYVCNETGD